MRMYIGAHMNQSFRKDYLDQKKKQNNNLEANPDEEIAQEITFSVKSI